MAAKDAVPDSNRPRGSVALKVRGVSELGWKVSSQYALYQLGLKSGHYRRTLQTDLGRLRDQAPGELAFPLPAHILCPAGEERYSTKYPGGYSTEYTGVYPADAHIDLTAADEIANGSFRPFGGAPVPLDLSRDASPLDWSAWREPAGTDVKDIWEPARLGWAVTLARAYQASGDERYPRAFWKHWETFQLLHPAYTGPHWQSGQEVALRAIHLCAALSGLRQSPQSTPVRMDRVARSLAEHAARIPPTLAYARSQRNNHLLSETAGLYTVSRFLPDHPRAAIWRAHGWHEFEAALLDQIDSDGTYAQQSVCYHRMMLSLAVWMDTLRGGEEQFSAPTLEKLSSAVAWLETVTAGSGGEAWNLGSNDGSLILPLWDGGMRGYLGMLGMARDHFGDSIGYLHPVGEDLTARDRDQMIGTHSFRRLEQGDSILFLRTAQNKFRPAHADQLHVDVWWQGVNILRDAGTFRYNAPAPWENSLAGSEVHNTVTVDGRDQMTRAGKFLWVNRAHISVDPPAADGSVTARHDGYSTEYPGGYHSLGIRHERQVQPLSAGWQIDDRLSAAEGGAHLWRLHWLLPDALPEASDVTPAVLFGKESADWRWSFTGDTLILRGMLGVLRLRVTAQADGTQPEYCLFRAGERLLGSRPVQPIWGWYSPTYSCREPALALAVYLHGPAPMRFSTTITWEDAVLPSPAGM